MVGALFFHVIVRSDTYVDIVTDQLQRRRPALDLDRRRLASWMRATSLLGARHERMSLGVRRPRPELLKPSGNLCVIVQIRLIGAVP